MDHLSKMYNMLNRVEFLDKLNANTQKRLESGRKTQILSDVDRLKAAAQGIAQLNSDLAKMRGLSVRSQTDAPRPQAIPKGFPKAAPKAKAKSHASVSAKAKAKATVYNPATRMMERVHEEYLREPRGTEYFDISPRPKAKAEPTALRRLRPIGQSTLDAFARR